jgi:hypothetical protein
MIKSAVGTTVPSDCILAVAFGSASSSVSVSQLGISFIALPRHHHLA